MTLIIDAVGLSLPPFRVPLPAYPAHPCPTCVYFFTPNVWSVWWVASVKTEVLITIMNGSAKNASSSVSHRSLCRHTCPGAGVGRETHSHSHSFGGARAVQ